MANLPTISVCSPNGSSWRWYEPDIPGQAHWLFHTEDPQSSLEKVIKRPNMGRIANTFRCVQDALQNRSDLIVAHSARTTFWISVAMKLLGVQIPLISYSCNFPKLPTGLSLHQTRWTFSQVQRFVVHSTLEQQRYAAYFGLPLDRFDVVRWGVRPSDAKIDTPPYIPGSYICAIGKDRRDYPPLIAAMDKLPHLKLVIVAQPHNLGHIQVPDNVQILYDTPLKVALNILNYSQFMALPLEAEDIPCGHITLVWSMLSRKAFVATRSRGITDYIPNLYEAPTVAAGDVQGWVDALQLMTEDSARRQRCEDLGEQFAHTCCSHQAALKNCIHILNKEGININP